VACTVPLPETTANDTDSFSVLAALHTDRVPKEDRSCQPKVECSHRSDVSTRQLGHVDGQEWSVNYQSGKALDLSRVPLVVVDAVSIAGKRTEAKQ
jgi:hypothetical protein